MGYPGAYKNTFLINSAAAAVPPNSGSFRKIVATDAGTVLVKGHGLYDYLTANNASATSYIDPTTGVAFDANDNAAGYYEALSTVEVTITLEAGQVVEGEFLSAKRGTATGVTAYT